MKLELYKPYKTRGGWKAVPVEKREDGDFTVWHENKNATYMHKTTWECVYQSRNHDLIEEWKEPIKRTVYISLHHNGEWTAGDNPYCPNSGLLAEKKITITEGEFDE